jgi:hypothetical protein
MGLAAAPGGRSRRDESSCAAGLTLVVFLTQIDMGAAGQPGALAGAEPDKRKQHEANRPALAATAATNGITEKEEIRPVAHTKVRGSEIGGTALAAIGNHRAIILRPISSGKASAQKAAPLCEPMIPVDEMSRKNCRAMAKAGAAGVHSAQFLRHVLGYTELAFSAFLRARRALRPQWPRPRPPLRRASCPLSQAGRHRPQA